jgi:hypothetical protein
MANCQPKQLKFVGEEKFMCRKGTKERYLMLVAETNIAKLQDAVDVLPLEPTTVLNPNEVPKEVAQTTMTPPVLISVPNWEAMSCNEILSEIQSIQDMLMTSKFSIDVVNQYNQIISEGKATFTRKCENIVAEPVPADQPILPTDQTPKPVETAPIGSTTTITTTGVPIIQTTGAFKPPVGGVGGGGGGATKVEPTKAMKINWLWVVIGVTGAYLLLKRK